VSLHQLHLLGSPVLRQRAHEVARFDDGVKVLAADLLETMRAAKGVGLAANQIGVARRVAVVVVDDREVVLVNPVIVEADGDEVGEEGCLSIPDIFADVGRVWMNGETFAPDHLHAVGGVGTMLQIGRGTFFGFDVGWSPDAHFTFTTALSLAY
jgi:hypothetical protein